MDICTDTLKIGIEEELFLVDKQTRELVSAIPEDLLNHFKQHYPGQIVQEFLLPQLEIISAPHDNLVSLRTELVMLRQAIIQACDDYGMAPIAASTHPFSHWSQYQPNDSARYQRLSDDLQLTARRFLVAGMHIHVGIDNDDARLQALHALCRYLPYMSALSSSSPFWAGNDSGMSSYRLSVIDDLPRSGLPHAFASLNEYQEYVEILTAAGAIQSGSEIWWDLRLSCRFPTVEMRITDVCAELSDAMAIAAFYLCLFSWLQRRSDQSEFLTVTQQALIAENRWRSQRYTLTNCQLINEQQGGSVALKTLITDLLGELSVDANILGCTDELAHIETILSRGTSADQQRLVYQQAITAGVSRQQALCDVVDHLITATVPV